MPPAQSEAEIIQIIQMLGQRRTLGRIIYRKPGEDWRTERVIEPYSFSYNHSGNLILLTWQMDPRLGEPCWRNFRTDRIQAIQNEGRPFLPRCPITVHTGESAPFRWGEQAENGPRSAPSAQEQYFLALEQALLDNELTSQESKRLTKLQTKLNEGEVKAIHAQAYANLIDEVVADGYLTADDEDTLATRRVFLTSLGGCP